MRERAELLTDVSQFDTSSRTARAQPGDAVVLHNRNGFWALVCVERTYLREALNRESVVEFRYVIQPKRTPDLSGFTFPGSDVEDTDGGETPDQ